MTYHDSVVRLWREFFGSRRKVRLHEPSRAETMHRKQHLQLLASVAPRKASPTLSNCSKLSVQRLCFGFDHVWLRFSNNRVRNFYIDTLIQLLYELMKRHQPPSKQHKTARNYGPSPASTSEDHCGPPTWTYLNLVRPQAARLYVHCGILFDIWNLWSTLQNLKEMSSIQHPSNWIVSWEYFGYRKSWDPKAL